MRYLAHGVAATKIPRSAVYDRAEALVAALGALPHVLSGFREGQLTPAQLGGR
jgi:hypothetical protein